MPKEINSDIKKEKEKDEELIEYIPKQSKIIWKWTKHD